jgi:hypothetical protein
MKILKCIWLLIMLFNITVTHAQKVSDSISKDNSLQCVHKFSLGENKTSFLNVYQDTINNYVMFKTIRYYSKNFSEVGTISGAGNIDFVKGKIFLKSYYFEPNNKVYAMEMYVKGSTYGASMLFIIYDNDGLGNWEIIRCPFESLRIVTNKANISKIVRYKDGRFFGYYTFKDRVIQWIGSTNKNR